MRGGIPWGLLVAPYERTTSFLAGAAGGPQMVLDDLERISREEETPQPRAVLRLPDRALANPRRMVRALADLTAAIVEEGLLPVMLGGEHTCTLGPLSALRERGTPLGVVHLDAHADQRDTYQGSRYSHASVMRRVSGDLGLPVLSVGIRAFSRREMARLREGGIGHIPGHLLGEWRRLLPPLLAALPAEVYLTVDMDFFDPAVVPGVGTPEPGGADWYTALDIIGAVLAARRLAGVDVVELCPPVEGRVSVRAASRVLLHILEAAGGREVSV